MTRRLWKKKLPAREDKPFKERGKIAERVFDGKTIEQLHEFFNIGVLEGLDFPIAQGKEAIVFRARGKGGKLVAVKIYKYETSSFQRTMYKYIGGDPRFHVRKGLRQLVDTWARKEFANLQAAEKAGAAVPSPIKQRRNVIVMKFIGENGTPSKLLKDTALEDPKAVMEEIIKYMNRLYNKAGIVHADLNEFNILMQGGRPVFIDLGQGVSIKHPLAGKFLENDCHNIAKFFAKHGVDIDKQRVLERVFNL